MNDVYKSVILLTLTLSNINPIKKGTIHMHVATHTSKYNYSCSWCLYNHHKYIIIIIYYDTININYYAK